jgi:HK97 family phage prohead protease
MKTKYATLEIKRVPSDGSGTFTGLAATYDQVPDHQNDVIEFGAFADSILEWRARGVMPPVFFNHDAEMPNSRIGTLVSVQETKEGLPVTGQLNLDNPLGLRVYESLLDGSLDSMSIGYAVYAEHKREDGVNVLTRLALIEISLTPSPANPRARVLSVKSDDDVLAEFNKQLDALFPIVKSDVVDRFVEETRRVDAAARAEAAQVEQDLDAYVMEPRDANVTIEDLLTLNPALRRLAREDVDV